jgi:hypothetical protein
VITFIGIIFAVCFFKETLPKPTHRRHSSVASSISEAETLVGSEPAKDSWGFRDLMRYRPVQVISVTMFLNA